MTEQHLAHGNLERCQGHGNAGNQHQIEHVCTDDIADTQRGVALLQGGDGGHQLRQGGAQGHEGQGNHRFGHAQFLGDDGAVLHQQVGTHGNQGRAHHQQHQLHNQRTGGLHFFHFLNFCLVGIGKTLTDGGDHVKHKDHQHDHAHPAGELAQNVGSHAVNGGRGEEEQHRHFHGLDIHGAGIAGHGNGSNQGGVADDGADGVAIGHCALAHEGSGGGDHDLRQGGADGDHGGTHDDVRQVEPLGKARSAVHEPVAALDEQNQTDSKQKNGC